MMLGSMYTASIRSSDHKRTGKSPSRSRSNTAEVIVDLIQAGIEKPFKLNLGDGTETVHRHTKGCRHNPQFCQRSVHHSIRAKFFLESVCDSEDHSFLPHILPQNNNPVISFHLLPKT